MIDKNDQNEYYYQKYRIILMSFAILQKDYSNYTRMAYMNIVLYQSLDEIKESIEKKSIYSGYSSTNQINPYSLFNLVECNSFPFIICGIGSHLNNINSILHILNTNTSQLFLLEEHCYAHGMWEFPEYPLGKMVLFDNIGDVKKYCSFIIRDNNNNYFNISNQPKEDIQNDYKQIENSTYELENNVNQIEVTFTLGIDLFYDITIRKTKMLTNILI